MRDIIIVDNMSNYNVNATYLTNQKYNLTTGIPWTYCGFGSRPP